MQMHFISADSHAPIHPPSSIRKTPRIYVASLSDYDAGRHFGCWMDATDVDAMREQIAEMLAHSPEPDAEQWAIHDHDGFSGIEIDTFEELDVVAEAARLIEDYGELAARVLAHVGGLSHVEAARAALSGHRSRPRASTR
jgi:antirestriction protein